MDENSERDPGFRERLAQVIGDRDPYPWAESLGIGKSTFAGPWRNGAMPQTKTLLKIAQHTNISLNWLLTGLGPMRIENLEKGSEPPDTRNQQKSPPERMGTEWQLGTPVADMGESYRVPREEYVLVPRHGVQGSEGKLLPSEQVVDHLSFRVSWIKQTMGLDPKQLALVVVRGDSMEPTLKEGDLLLLDRRGFSTLGRINNDAIYVLLRGEELVAKRLQCGFDGSITIQSDNPVYATQTLSAATAATLKIIGRVVWVGRRI